MRQCSFVGGEIVSLPLCLVCYRRFEERVCDNANKALREINIESKRMKEELENPELELVDRIAYQELLREAVRLQHEIIASRRWDLSEFRRSQGVWGDG